MIKIIHASDFHLERSFHGSSIPAKYSEERRQDLWKSVENLIEYSQKVIPNYTLLVGDLYEREFFTLSDHRRLLDLLASIPGKVFITAGNHDYIDDNSLLKMLEIPENIYIFKENYFTSYEDDFVDIYGISYHDRSLIINNLDEIKLNPKKINLLMMHGDIINPNNKYLPIPLHEFKNYKFNYIALGHIHKPMKIDEYIVYPGSIEPMSFKERGAHGISYVEIDDKTHIQLIPMARSEYLIEDYYIDDILEYYDLVQFIKSLQSRNKKTYLRLILKGTLSPEYEIDFELMEKELSEYIHYIEIVNELLFPYDIDEIYEMNKSNIIGQFVKNFKDKNQEDPIVRKALHYGLHALMEKGKE